MYTENGCRKQYWLSLNVRNVLPSDGCFFPEYQLGGSKQIAFQVLYMRGRWTKSCQKPKPHSPALRQQAGQETETWELCKGFEKIKKKDVELFFISISRTWPEKSGRDLSIIPT